MRWLRRFFYSDDPEIRVAAGVNEPMAKMARELLKNNGIPAMIKNVSFLTVDYVFGPGLGGFNIWVRSSDLARAREILEAVLDPAQLVDDEA